MLFMNYLRYFLSVYLHRKNLLKGFRNFNLFYIQTNKSAKKKHFVEIQQSII